MRQLDVCVVGSLNLDLVVRVERLPRPGETVLGGSFARFPGGKGANQAVASARAGARTAMVGCVGRDEHGRALLAALARERVDTRAVACVREPSGVAVIAVARSGENSIVVAPGANARTTPARVAAARRRLERASVVVAQLEVPPESVRRAFEVARAAGATTLLNAAPARALPKSLLALADVLVVNEIEARALLGRRSSSANRAALLLVRLGPRCAIVTLGRRGAVVARDGRATRLRAHRVRAVDTTGAGDAFVGALAAELARGADALDAARFASAAGALATTRPGAIPSMPRRERIAALARPRP
jgi:ribokinase